MKRRSFIKLFATFTGVLAFGSRFELARAFPFVRRKPAAPQIISTVTAKGTRVIRLPVSYALKGDVLIAVVAAHNPDGAPIAIDPQGEWTMFARQEIAQCTQESWYMKTERDLENTEYLFAVHNAERSAGQLSVVRGADVEHR